MDSRVTSIYILFDPREPEVIRYVGKSIEVNKRIVKHRNIAKNGKISHLYNWVRKIKSEGVDFDYKVIETCTDTTWSDRERYWIKFFRGEGHPLTNIVDGGQGTGGRPLTEEHKEILRKMRTGAVNSEETRLRIRESLVGRKGTPHTEESKRKISAANKGRGHSQTEETRTKISETLKSQPSAKPAGATGFRYILKRGDRFRISIKASGYYKDGFKTAEEANQYLQWYMEGLVT